MREAQSTAATKWDKMDAVYSAINSQLVKWKQAILKRRDEKLYVYISHLELYLSNSTTYTPKHKKKSIYIHRYDGRGTGWAIKQQQQQHQQQQQQKAK